VTELSGKYYDGVTSEPTHVTITLDEEGTLHVHGLLGPVSHPLASAVIAPRLGNTMRSITFPNGAQCETDDHAALAELERRSGKGGGLRWVHALESSWRSALGATVVLILLLVVGVKWGIPVLADRVARAIPPELAYDIGRGTLATLDKIMLEPSKLSLERQAELSRSFETMSKSYRELPLELVFRRGVGPNAFALPDGTVIVTDELVELAKNDNEILSVLAHEIGHVHHRHGLRMALESSTVVLLVSTYFGDVTQLTTLSAALPGVYAQARYSRDHETEADSFALEYLEKNRIPKRHFADILRSLQKFVGPDPKHGLQYLSSHPPTTERVQRFEH
jgi:Zn-dependent protease with chaperone function